ncbi:MAG: MBOAT family protein, partial [Acetobacteraceae bacterium]|nr:MBOAT family protein [Acetobacteraceae bacterium]
MLFYEPLFLFVFLPTFYLLYLAFERGYWARLGVILFGSFVFYEWSDPLFPLLVLASSLADWVIARAIARFPRGAAGAKVLLTLGILLNLAMLVHFKYTHFVIENLNVMLTGFSWKALENPLIALPVGVSFVVFEKITYLVDVYRRISRPARNLFNYLTYVFFFPKLLAGPIIKYHEMEAQLAALPAARWDDISDGFSRFMLGIVKKALIADTVGLGVDRIFAADPHAIGFADAWLGVVLFTFQIYFDFSAYSDMAIGIARMLGFRLRENFNMPYLSCSMTEFWRRWHISLATWIRDYLYIPLGGNRVPVARRYLNLWVCFLASGLWHGAAWPYVVWGAYNGLFLVLDKLFLLRVLDRMPRLAANLLTFFVVMVGWTIFRARSLDQAGAFFSAMLQPGLAGRAAGVFVTPDITFAAALAAFICAVPRLPGYDRLRRAAFASPGRVTAVRTAIALAFVLAVGKAVADPFTPFLY